MKNQLVKIDKIKFNNLIEVNLGGRGGNIVNTQLQNRILNVILTPKLRTKKSINWDTLVEIYIECYGDKYFPKTISIDTQLINPGVDYSSLRYHYDNNTIEWKLIIKKKLRERFIKVFGQLVMNGMLKLIPNIK